MIIMTDLGGLTMVNKYSRQIDIINPDLLQTPIRIIGAGGIGSWTTLALAKMGCSNITVQDFDIVGEENTASQIYSQGHIGMDKTTALGGIIKFLTDIDINPEFDKWEPTQEIKEKILILALDNLETRRQIWEEAKLNPQIRLVIDGRMAGDFLRIFFIPLNGDYEEYEKTFVPPEKVDPTPCTAKAVVYNVFMTASLITNFVKLYVKGELTTFKEISFDFVGLQTL